MMRSMYSCVSGLKVHQQMMDVIGNNISNINTIGYKGSRITFKEMLSQTLKGAAAPGDNQGGTNPQQIGLGVSTGSIDNIMDSGNLQPTGKKTDVAIQGDGFFVVNNGDENMFTRAGSFTFDSEGYLASSTNGYRVQGWFPNGDGEFDTSADPTSIDLNKWLKGQPMPAEASTNISFNGNLSASIENEVILDSDKISVDDGAGNITLINMELTDTDNFNQWELELTPDDTAVNIDHDTVYLTVTKDGLIQSINSAKDGSGVDLNNGTLNLSNGTSIDLAGVTDDLNDDSFSLFSVPSTGDSITTNYRENAERNISADVYDSLGEKHTVKFTVDKQDINKWIIDEDSVLIDSKESSNCFNGVSPVIQFDSFGNLKEMGDMPVLTFQPDNGSEEMSLTLDFKDLNQFSGEMTADFEKVDGYKEGYFQSISIDPTGTITGSFNNGQNKVLSKLSIAKFSNPEGLIREGGLFKVSNNSGQPRIDAAGVNGRGKLAPSTLEMSNIDLAAEFTEMITAQRGFQASSKMISTSDQMLQDLVNLKR